MSVPENERPPADQGASPINTAIIPQQEPDTRPYFLRELYPKTPDVGTGRPTGPPATSYASKAFHDEVARLARTPQGQRNDQLNRSAFNLAQLAAGGHLDGHLVWDTLHATALRIGLTRSETEGTLRSAFDAGSRQPRTVPELAAVPVPAVTPVDLDTVTEETLDASAQKARDVERRLYGLEVERDARKALDARDGALVEPNYVTGGSFILDFGGAPEPVWGHGQEVLWAAGEALMIVGGSGVGKTTLAQQLTLGRCGIEEYAALLGYPIEPGERRTLYLAMDRPAQIARSFARMVGTAWREELDGRLAVLHGPPPWDLAMHPEMLLKMCRDNDADTVVVDSMKDAAAALEGGEAGQGYNRARQIATAEGVQVLELHHQRKAVQESTTGRKGIDEVYGSAWLTAGAGSVLILTGAPGDPVVGLHHVKQPAEPVGPLQIAHQHEVGRTAVHHAADLVELARATRDGITAVEAAMALEDVEKPSANQKEKARRRLDRLVDSGHLERLVEGDKRTSSPTRWGAV